MAPADFDKNRPNTGRHLRVAGVPHRRTPQAHQTKMTPKPCPFCGEPGRVESDQPQLYKLGTDPSNSWTCGCLNVHCPVLADAEGSTQEEAIKAWNTRHVPINDVKCDKQLYGWYSAEQARLSGTVRYRTPFGAIVHVTAVSEDKDHKCNFQDIAFVGFVTEFINRHSWGEIGQPPSHGWD